MLLAHGPNVTKGEKALQQDDTILVAQAIKELPYVTQSYEALIKRHYPLIFRSCMGILHDSAEAEEISQVILLKVFNGLPRFQGRSKFKTWLMKIVTNTCFSRYQKLKQERERYSDFSKNKADDNLTYNEAPINLEDDFESMVSSLSDEQQKILNLRFVSELSLAEIAEVMGVGLSATKMRFYRALEHLKQQV